MYIRVRRGRMAPEMMQYLGEEEDPRDNDPNIKPKLLILSSVLGVLVWGIIKFGGPPPGGR